MLFLLSHISTLANQLNSEQPFSFCTHVIWTRAVEEIKSKLDGMITAASSTGAMDSTETLHLAFNLAFIFIARLLLQRKCGIMPTDKVQDTVREILKAIRQVPIDGGSDNALLFPLFFDGINAQGVVLC